jgi:hypothetical protein
MVALLTLVAVFAVAVKVYVLTPDTVLWVLVNHPDPPVTLILNVPV